MIDSVVQTFGRLDGAFNNAGVEQTPGRITETNIADLDYTWAVKGRGTFLCRKYEIPAMVAGGGGAIVNHGSVVSERTFPQYPAPAATQGAIPGLTKAAAAGHGAENIRVNMIYTGCVLTKERATGAEGDARRAAMAARTALGRAGASEDVAAMAGWLLSDYAAFVSGACIPVDGGHLARQ
jgi:NAD(P)-dependent dehydrogenase (short-subunit alcohol dehydrogenase family)